MAAAKPNKNGSPAADLEDRLRKAPIDEDFGFQKRQWQVERVAWSLMALTVAAALAGVFGGGGPLNRGVATSANGTTELQYGRFARYLAPMSVDVNVSAPSGDRPLRLRVSDEYLSAMNVRSITPSPTSTALGDRQHIYVFDRGPSRVLATIRLELEPTSIGLQRGWIAVDDGAPLSFSHFVYP